MGHKVHPHIHRSPILFPWSSRWVAGKNYADKLKQDIQIREYLAKKFGEAHIDSVFIERNAKNMTVTIFAAKPGIIIGRGGQGLDDLRKDIERQFLQMRMKVKLNIQEVSQPALSANIIGQSIVKDTLARLPFRRVMKNHIEKVMKAGGQGVKIKMSGRLNGVEIARTEVLASGKVPLITLRSHVDYATARANTLYGVIGIKVWIYKGESFERVDKLADAQDKPKKKK